MTVLNTTNTVREAGNGVKVAFDFDFKIFREEDLEIFKIDTTVDPEVETLQTLNVDYTVSINTATEGGTVTYSVAPGNATEDSFIRRTLELNQETKIPRESNFPEVSINNENDRSRMIDIQLQEQLDRAPLFPIGSGVTSFEFPAPEADQFIGWNSTATALINLPDPSIAAAASAAAAAASAAAAATSEANASASATSASTSATNASTSETNASTSETNAAASETCAQEWANRAEDSLIPASCGGDLVDDYSALHHAAKAAASAAAVNLPTPVFPANEGQILVARAAAAVGSYDLEAQGTSTVVDDFTIQNIGGEIQTAPFILDNIMLNAMNHAAEHNTSLTGLVDGFVDTYTDETGIATNTDGDFEGGSYRTPVASVANAETFKVNANSPGTEVADISSNQFSVTQNGGTILDSSFSKFGDTSCYFDGSSYLTVGDNSDFDFGANDFSIDLWFYDEGGTGNKALVTHSDSGGNGAYNLYRNSSGNLIFEATSDGTNIVLTVTDPYPFYSQGFHHLLVVRNGNDTGMYVDSYQVGHDDSTGLTIFNSTSTLGIGVINQDSSPLWQWEGYMDDL